MGELAIVSCVQRYGSSSLIKHLGQHIKKLVGEMTFTWSYYRDSAADSLSACYYHLAEMKKADEYRAAYAHTKALIFEIKSTLDSIAATLNGLFELGIVNSHVFFNKEFIDKFNAQTRFPIVKEKTLTAHLAATL